MPVVRINDATFAHINTLKTWFGTKSPSETIDRLVQVAQEMMRQLGIAPEHDKGDAGAPSSKDGISIFNTTPSLSYTHPIIAMIGGESVPKPTWASIRREIFDRIQSKGCEGKKLLHELGRRFKPGNHDKNGYTYSPELDISIPGLSANDAWKEIDRLAQKWGIPVEVRFEWEKDPRAKHPGEKGIIRSGGF